MKKNIKTNATAKTTTKKGVKNTMKTRTTSTKNTATKNTKKEVKNMNKVINFRMTRTGYPTIEMTQNGNGEMVDVSISGITFSMDAKSANELYLDRLENGYKVKEEKKASAPKEPKVEKTVEDKKAEREQRLTEKYGDIDTRRAFAVRRSEIWKEESAKIAEAVKNGTMKRLSKDVWKKTMNEAVNKRMVEEGFTVVR